MKDKSYYDKVFSTERMSKYYAKYANDWEKAVDHYKMNILLSEAFYPLLSVYEVSLRNSLNRELTDHFRTTEWYTKIHETAGLSNLKPSIISAQKHIANRDEIVNGNKIVAELTMGFWVRLLNAEYERILWKPLRRAFPYIEKKKRQRNTVSAPLNKIREFRNRVFHHEPIFWHSNKMREMNDRIIKVLGWINRELPDFVEDMNRVPIIIDQVNDKIS